MGNTQKSPASAITFSALGLILPTFCLFQKFPQFIVIHTVKGFGIVNKTEIDVFFWNSLAFSMIQQMLASWSLVPLTFLKPSWTSGSSQFTYCWSLVWRILRITLLACEMGQNKLIKKTILKRKKEFLACANHRVAVGHWTRPFKNGHHFSKYSIYLIDVLGNFRSSTL